MPDSTTVNACRWLSAPGEKAAVPAPDHDLFPMLSAGNSCGSDRLVYSAEHFRKQQVITPVADLIAQRSIPVWVFKGFDLAESLYPFPGARSMNDVDIYIRTTDRQQVVSCFRADDWQLLSPGYGTFTSNIVSELKAFKNGVLVEVHTHIFYFPATFPGRLPCDLFSSWRELSGGFRGFDWHNALLLVLLHMALNPVLRPVWWVDVFLLARKVDRFGMWNKFAVNAAGTELGRTLAFLLSASADYLDAPVPGSVIEFLKLCSSRDYILNGLLGKSPIPSITNLLCCRDWRALSMLLPILLPLVKRRTLLHQVLASQ